MEVNFNILMGGITLGAIYSLLAVAFVMVMKATDIVHFALGEFLMIATVIALVLFEKLGISLLLSSLIAILFTGMIGFSTDRFVVRPLKDSPIVNVVFGTVAISIILQNAVLIFWRGDTASFPSFFDRNPRMILGLRIVPENLAVIAIAGLCVIILQLFFTKTRLGIAMRAVMIDRETASIMGVRVHNFITLTFVVSAVLAAIAGLMVAPLIHVTYDMGTILIKAFVAAVIGGLYSIPGAIYGSFLLGVMENFTTAYISSDYRDVIVYSLLILGLLFKPSGLFKWGKG